MPSKSKEPKPEPKQRTEKGLEIPVPKWREILRDLEKVAKPSERREGRRRPSK
jgi:hypothetical protein